ncbi:hypothetical protein [Streptomyces scopuliridis]|uniref:hypothetical protein n=1 Tax=Streptomyces scopuliridis TaxID=452529 RepID=UPI0036C7BCBD
MFVRKALVLSAAVTTLLAGTSFAPAYAEAAEPGVIITDGDRVHVSSTPPPTASAHGWWKKVSGPGDKARVTIDLQVKNADGSWRTVATGSKVVKPGGGSARRANARKQCVNVNRTIHWRSVIDVDIIGVVDSPEKAVTATQSLRCAV